MTFAVGRPSRRAAEQHGERSTSNAPLSVGRAAICATRANHTLSDMNSNGHDGDISNGETLTEEQQAKVIEMRKLLGPLPERLSLFCSDACIARYLVARSWNLKKALKMLKETLRWRLQYKPEEIRWEDIAMEAETGKIYRTNLLDRHGRSILVMRPGHQNTKSVKGQIRYLVYCMENAILNLAEGQSQMVWWIDYDAYKLTDVSLAATKETSHILQDHYPERLGVAILYNPPKFFEPFWKMAKPFLDPRTREKVKFIYADDPASKQIVDDVLGPDSDVASSDLLAFDLEEYARRMREDDERNSSLWKSRDDGDSAVLAPPVVLFSDSEDSSRGNGGDAQEEPK